MTGLSFIVIALFMLNNPVMAKTATLPRVPAINGLWPEHIPLASAVDNIQRTQRDANAIEWVNAKVAKTSRKSAAKRTIFDYGLHNIDSPSNLPLGGLPIFNSFDLDDDGGNDGETRIRFANLNRYASDGADKLTQQPVVDSYDSDNNSVQPFVDMAMSLQSFMGMSTLIQDIDS
jgi:hypothetical protein